MAATRYAQMPPIVDAGRMWPILDAGRMGVLVDAPRGSPFNNAADSLDISSLILYATVLQVENKIQGINDLSSLSNHKITWRWRGRKRIGAWEKSFVNERLICSRKQTSWRG